MHFQAEPGNERKGLSCFVVAFLRWELVLGAISEPVGVGSFIYGPYRPPGRGCFEKGFGFVLRTGTRGYGGMGPLGRRGYIVENLLTPRRVAIIY